MLALGDQCLRRFVQHRSQHGVAGLRHAAITFDVDVEDALTLA